MDRVDSRTQSSSSSAAAATAAAGININRQEDNKRKLLQLQVETGAQSLQTQLAHLYHHHQQNSSHSPYIDFQNVLYSQSNTSAAPSLPKGSGPGPGPGLGASISLSSSSASNSPLVSQVNHISQAYSSPFSPVSPMTVPLDKPIRRRSVLTMGEALEPILATSPVLHLAQAQQTTQQPQSAHQQPQQGSLALPQRNINASSKKRRDSIPYLPLHFDMEMQIDSVVPGPGGAGVGTGTGTGAGIGTRTGLGVAGTSINNTNGAGGGGHGSSTLTEFTKRRNWSQRIIEELQDLLCILTPSGKIRYTSPNTKHITGFTTDELLGRMITEFVHIDDSHIFIREFNEAIASAQPLRIFFRFRRKDDTYAIFESNGHPHFSDQRQLPSNTATPVCSGFFMMARLYPTKNVALLDSFLEHKIENERLKRRIAELKLEEQEEQAAQARARSEAAAAVAAALNAEGSADGNPATVVGALASNSMPPPAMPGQLTRQNLEGLNNSALRSDSLRDKMARYEGVTHTDAIEMLTGLRYNEGERSRGISTGDTSPSLIRGDAGVPISTDRESRGSGERKKKIKVSNEYVCTDCGTLDSPEWRKGPTGPKT
ncbi:blue light receptor, variant 2 [Orbilia oligospora]|nr:blue light receptor, variant 2 [Orbilia oligospora]KAF3205332.1 blue light receptor, variant 2 [Orbilia oligospora]